MKPPVPLNPLFVIAILVLSVAAALLPLGGPSGEQAGVSDGEPAAEIHAAAADAAPDAGWRERDYLLHYAEVICLRAAYGALEPAPSQVLEALDAEGWSMIELSHQQPAVYHVIHMQAWAAGAGQVSARALAGCNAWVKGAAGGILRSAAGSD